MSAHVICTAGTLSSNAQANNNDKIYIIIVPVSLKRFLSTWLSPLIALLTYVNTEISGITERSCTRQ